MDVKVVAEDEEETKGRKVEERLEAIRQEETLTTAEGSTNVAEEAENTKG